MKQAKLKEICKVSWGDTTVTKSSYVDFGYPAFSATGCDGFLPYYDHEGPGIVLSAIGAQCGKIWFTKGKWSCIKNTIYIKSKSLEADTEYIFYALSNPEIWPKRGAAQPFISQTDALNVEIPLPPLTVQRRIVGILSDYDQLIENSQRRIKILESIARGLYREWFVHFRFPGHESCMRVSSALGEIPQGWEVKRFGEVVILNYGKALKKEDRCDGDFRVFGSSGVVGTHNAALVKGPGIIVGRKGNVGSVFWCDDDFYVIDTAYFVTSSLPLRYLFYVLPTLNFINSDAAVPGLSRNQAYTLEVLVPPDEILNRFCALANTIEFQASLLHRQIKNLRLTRDLLLPRLLSGKIQIETEAV